ncbi:GFA family protein [Zooshikella harenae]|uniref:GFA family protein n=1 Tax=Zooshikella harenae TaxID=2827238 RepID=A0ABS5ZG14_9GAMM|nr:GFA family protein [Zooshikella harenae]MBU2712988.1 GFA family protein [Zooshikella harenae]
MSAYFNDEQSLLKEGDVTMYSINKEYTQQKRYFCSQCGTTLYWLVEQLPGKLGVAGGCFVNDSFPEPTYTVANETKCAWLTLPSNWKTSLV